jgi:beta-glucosidase
VRNGRNFEYYSEDPLLCSAVLGAEAVSQRHPGRGRHLDAQALHAQLQRDQPPLAGHAIIEPDAHCESDLLAFHIAIERSQPGSIMCGYNTINGEYASGNHPHLLNEVLKNAWGYPGCVMSDWGATASLDFALKGLDQDSGVQRDMKLWRQESFTAPLR